MANLSIASFLIALTALGISTLTFWLTLLRRGTVRMTQPALIFLGPDGGGQRHPKVYLRTLLYSTSKRGQLIENLYVSLTRGEARQNFNIWVYGDRELARGSGLFVGEEGITANHHFLLPKDDDDSFAFKAGDYVLEVFARRVGDKEAARLCRVALQITSADAEQMRTNSAGLMFDWGSDAQAYRSHIDRRPQPLDVEALIAGALVPPPLGQAKL